MLKFVNVGQRMPDKRAVTARRTDFDEIYQEFDPSAAAEQAARCSQCGVPFCQVHCPLHNNIPDWLMLTAEGRLEEAYELAQATNNFPEICGRICPQDRLCEGNCVIEQAGHGTVTIGSVEKYITETAWDQGWVKPAKPHCASAKASVGIIGAGPAGLAAGEELRRKGYQVTIYDRYDRVGGLLVYGIPNFKLEKEVVERRAKLIADGGVTFKLNFEVGRDATLAGAARAATTPYWSRPASTRRGTSRCRASACPRSSPATRLSDRLEPQGPGRRGAGFRRRHAGCPRQACRRGRRRRHGDGLRAHRGAPGRQVGQVPLPPRPPSTCPALSAR